MIEQVNAVSAVRAGTLAELQEAGRLVTKIGSVPVVVFWHEGAAYAIEDRCPHLGFPLHQGTVEAYSEGVGKGSSFRIRLPVLRG